MMDKILFFEDVMRKLLVSWKHHKIKISLLDYLEDIKMYMVPWKHHMIKIWSATQTAQDKDTEYKIKKEEKQCHQHALQMMQIYMI